MNDRATVPTLEDSAFFMPFSMNRHFKKAPRMLSRAEGIYYYTSDGRKLIDGTYPDWRRVVPSANPGKLLVDPASFAAAIRRTQVVATEKTRSIKLSFESDKLTLSVSSPENGTASEEVPVAWGSPPLEVGFNSRYLLDTIAAIGGAELQVDLADAAAPTLFTNPADNTAQWVVMPTRV